MISPMQHDGCSLVSGSDGSWCRCSLGVMANQQCGVTGRDIATQPITPQGPMPANQNAIDEWEEGGGGGGGDGGGGG